MQWNENEDTDREGQFASWPKRLATKPPKTTRLQAVATYLRRNLQRFSLSTSLRYIKTVERIDTLTVHPDQPPFAWSDRDE